MNVPSIFLQREQIVYTETITGLPVDQQIKLVSPNQLIEKTWKYKFTKV